MAESARNKEQKYSTVAIAAYDVGQNSSIASEWHVYWERIHRNSFGFRIITTAHVLWAASNAVFSIRFASFDPCDFRPYCPSHSNVCVQPVTSHKELDRASQWDKIKHVCTLRISFKLIFSKNSLAHNDQHNLKYNTHTILHFSIIHFINTLKYNLTSQLKLMMARG